MIAFRQVDARYPFLWEDSSQPAGRWHADGEGPAHYFADTPDGAWAEFLRHEEITDPDDLRTIQRQMWAVEIGDPPAELSTLPSGVLTGGVETYARCQEWSRAMRGRGVRRMGTTSAALTPGGARGVRVDGGVQTSEPKDGLVIVIFGRPAKLLGWVAAVDARPPDDLLDRVNHYRPPNSTTAERVEEPREETVDATVEDLQRNGKFRVFRGRRAPDRPDIPGRRGKRPD